MEDIRNIKKIDIHAHATIFPDLYPPLICNTRLCSDEELLEMYDELGIESGVYLPISAPEGQVTMLPNEYGKILADKYPGRFYWFCNVDPRAVANNPGADLKSLLAYYKSQGAKGVGEITASLYFDDPLVDNLFSCCEELDMPVLFHMYTDLNGSYGLVDDLGMPRLERMLKKHPHLKIIGHSQCFWSEISADNNEEIRRGYPTGQVTDGRIAQLMRKYDNLYCDFSAGSGANALMRDPVYAACFLEEFADRVLYGCDIFNRINTFPSKFCEFLYDMVDSGALSSETYRKLVRTNAETILKL